MTANYTPYSQMLSKLQNMEEFKGLNVRAYYNGVSYIVKSYDTTILLVNTATWAHTYDARKYSPTTSRLQNLIKQAFPHLQDL